jgi:uncharacterized protein YfcZ (UPF0381/DUF406 family)
MSEESDKLNRVYGRGYYDGMKAAAKASSQEITMTETKFNSIYRGVTEQAKKVYSGVPLAEPWTVAQIMSELERLGHGHRELRMVSGCLNSLKEAGLIKEPAPGRWIRIDIRSKQPVPQEKVVAISQAKEEKEPPVPAINTQPVPEKSDLTPLERIGSLSARVLTIIQSLHQLAADIEATAIDVEEQIEKINKDGEKLKQLQTLLKSLS